LRARGGLANLRGANLRGANLSSADRRLRASGRLAEPAVSAFRRLCPRPPAGLGSTRILLRKAAVVTRTSSLILLIALLLSACCSDDDGDSTTESETQSCAEECTSSSGGPPANDCLVVNGSEQCVYTCSDDADCEAPFYTGCTATADDGTQICE
jgi:hypothetical protein